VIEWFKPESALEQHLHQDPQLQRGWAWGTPRHGHPEGAVGRHVAMMLDEIAADDPLRVQFNNLHNWSEWVLMAAMLAALIAFFIMANRKAAAAASSTTTNDPFDFSKEFRKS
jgi:hypothetical protein